MTPACWTSDAAMHAFWNSPSLRVLMSLSLRWAIPSLSRAFSKVVASCSDSLPAMSVCLKQLTLIKSLTENPLTFGIRDGIMVILLSVLWRSAIAFSSVVLPLPLAPQSIMQSPSWMSNAMFSYNTFFPWPIFNPSICISILLIAPVFSTLYII